MFRQSTRLELVIVGAAFVVLLFCRQPPKSGNARVVRDTGLTLQEPTPGMEDRGQKTEGREVSNPVPAFDDLRAPSAQPPLVRPPSGITTADNTRADASVPPPKTKLMGVVDATRCDSLNYKDVMFGEVTVEYVWDGLKSVPRKVCQVKEKNGTISTWIFNGRDDIAVSEIQQPQQ